VQHHRAVLADGVEHDRPLALSDDLAEDVDALGFELLQMGQCRHRVQIVRRAAPACGCKRCERLCVMNGAPQIAAGTKSCTERYKTVTGGEKLVTFRNITLQGHNTSLPLPALNFCIMAPTERTLSRYSPSSGGQLSGSPLLIQPSSSRFPRPL